MGDGRWEGGTYHAIQNSRVRLIPLVKLVKSLGHGLEGITIDFLWGGGGGAFFVCEILFESSRFGGPRFYF